AALLRPLLDSGHQPPLSTQRRSRLTSMTANRARAVQERTVRQSLLPVDFCDGKKSASPAQGKDRTPPALTSGEALEDAVMAAGQQRPDLRRPVAIGAGLLPSRALQHVRRVELVDRQ